MVSSHSHKLDKFGMAPRLFAGLMPDLVGDVEVAPLHDPTGRKPRGKILKKNTMIERRGKKIYKRPSVLTLDVLKEVMKKPEAEITKASFHHAHMNPCPHSYT